MSARQQRARREGVRAALASVALFAPQWRSAKFLCCAPGLMEASGFTRAGLGMRMVISPSPAGRRPPVWHLIHLGSGHRVVAIDASAAQAFAIADEIAQSTDWTFDGLDGWRNLDAGLPGKIAAIARAHRERVILSGGDRDETAARQIAMARA